MGLFKVFLPIFLLACDNLCRTVAFSFVADSRVPSFSIPIPSATHEVQYSRKATRRRLIELHADVPSRSEAYDTVVQTDSEVIEDPILEVAAAARSMNINGIVNTAVLVGVALLVLSKFASVDQDLMRGWSPAEVAYRLSIDNWNSYSAVLESAPITTKAVTSGTVYTIGDIISQRTEGKDMGELDRMRILRSLLAGLIGHGPLSHVWYQQSEILFNEVLKLTAWWSFFPKVVIDQLFWGPFWNNTYIVMLGIMKGTNIKDIWEEVKRTTVPLVVSGLKLWPLAHCVTYGLIPVENRLLWVDLVEIVWVTILATQANAVADVTHEKTESEEHSTAENAVTAH